MSVETPDLFDKTQTQRSDLMQESITRRQIIKGGIIGLTAVAAPYFINRALGPIETSMKYKSPLLAEISPSFLKPLNYSERAAKETGSIGAGDSLTAADVDGTFIVDSNIVANNVSPLVDPRLNLIQPYYHDESPFAVPYKTAQIMNDKGGGWASLNLGKGGENSEGMLKQLDTLKKLAEKGYLNVPDLTLIFSIGSNDFIGLVADHLPEILDIYDKHQGFETNIFTNPTTRKSFATDIGQGLLNFLDKNIKLINLANEIDSEAGEITKSLRNVLDDITKFKETATKAGYTLNHVVMMGPPKINTDRLDELHFVDLDAKGQQKVTRLFQQNPDARQYAGAGSIIATNLQIQTLNDFEKSYNGQLPYQLQYLSLAHYIPETDVGAIHLTPNGYDVAARTYLKNFAFYQGTPLLNLQFIP